MAQKRIHLNNIGEVVLNKRRGSRSLRLSVAHDGQVRVSMPLWTPYHVGQAFVLSKSSWLQKQLEKRRVMSVSDGDRIGKAHRVRIYKELRSKIATRVTDNEIIVRLPLSFAVEDEDTQLAIKAASVRALKQEAKRLLPTKLAELADLHGFNYRSVAIKQLRSRWGSCSSHFDIALNCYLMQLPWELIDYVLLHELNHTKVMAHGPRFWNELDKHVNNLPEKRRAIRAYQPSLLPVKAL
jgi:predicted metal-dependent hydrolase